MHTENSTMRQLGCRDFTVAYCVAAELAAWRSGGTILPFLRSDFIKEVERDVEVLAPYSERIIEY